MVFFVLRLRYRIDNQCDGSIIFPSPACTRLCPNRALSLFDSWRSEHMTRILSLDDEPEILKLLGVSLELAGYEHSHTTDGRKALDILRHERIDLLTQDIMRPKMDGWELYRLMKSDADLRHIPVLFISAGARADRMVECRALYNDDYLTKPFSPQELISAVTALLKCRGKRVPTEAERTVRYAQIRAKWLSAMNWTEQQLDSFYQRVGNYLTGMSQSE